MRSYKQGQKPSNNPEPSYLIKSFLAHIDKELDKLDFKTLIFTADKYAAMIEGDPTVIAYDSLCSGVETTDVKKSRDAAKAVCLKYALLDHTGQLKK